ncbi:MAG: CmcI family methyltransferase [Planctomycetota bacterium]
MPSEPGRYRLELTLVQEQVAWFESRGFMPWSSLVEVARVAPMYTASIDRRLRRCRSLRDARRPFRTWEEYLRWAILRPHELYAPYSEHDRRVIACMEGPAEDLPPFSGRVSVVMPVHNGADTVGAAIASVLAQTHPDWELLVIDDGSSDGTVDKVLSHADPRIVLLRHTDRRGVCAARNLGLAKATGHFIAYLDADNVWYPDFLERMAATLAAAPGQRLAYCAQRVVERFGDDCFESVRFAPYNRSLHENINFIDTNVLMHERSLVEELGGFNEQMVLGEDWELTLRYTRTSPPVALPALLSEYRYVAGRNHLSDTCLPNNRPASFADAVGEQFFRLPLAGRPPLPPRAEGYSFSTPNRRAARGERGPVTVIIPSYEAVECLESCLQSIFAFTDSAAIDVVVVDNGSSPAIGQLLAGHAASKAIRVVMNRHNHGFTAAVNCGLRLRRPGADVVLLNNDALVTPGWLESLQEVLTLEPNVGIVVPRQVLLPGTPTGTVHVPGADAHHEIDVSLSAHHANVLEPLANQAQGLVELSFAPFFCVYLTHECLEAVGLLDEHRGAHYHSDTLYCDVTRLKAGLRIIYTPHSKVYHFLQQSTAVLQQQDPAAARSLFHPLPVFHTHPASIPGPVVSARRVAPSRRFPPGNSYRRKVMVPDLSPEERSLVERFTTLYCSRATLWNAAGADTLSIGWLGHEAQKCPLDLWVYQELLVETAPDLIIECGTRRGGSSLFLASVCELLGSGSVVTIDVSAEKGQPVHPRLHYLHGSSVSPEVLAEVRKMAERADRVMVILDSDHSRDHVLAELRSYSGLVTAGCYLVVEDTLVNGHPFWPDFGPGPMEAVEDFLSEHAGFVVDQACERFLLTLNPRGFLRRVSEVISTFREPLETLKKKLAGMDGLSAGDGTLFPNHPHGLIHPEERRAAREEGRDWPGGEAVTMTGLRRLDRLQACLESVVREEVPGDFVELGVWRGGSCILARAVLRLLADTRRTVWVMDSFRGAPAARPDLFPADAGDPHETFEILRVSLEQVQANFRSFGQLDEQVRFVEGWFADTVPAAAIAAISVLRLDGDSYESTILALDHLYERVSPGGYVIVDDYGAVTACRQAVDSFREAHGIRAPLRMIDWTGCFWRVPARYSPAERQFLTAGLGVEFENDLDFWPGQTSLEDEELCAQARQAFDAGNLAVARALVRQVQDRTPNCLTADLLSAAIELPGPDYYACLQAMHAAWRPAVYLEVGVFRGESMRLAAGSCRAIGVDPRPVGEIPSWVELQRMTSADFFGTGHAERLLTEGVDLAFIDGAHDFEQVLRDFMALERMMTFGAAILIHDTLPPDSRCAARNRTTTFYTGDVWKVLAVLRTARPDLRIETIPCHPTGLTIVRGLNPRSRIIWDRFEDLVTSHRELGWDYFLAHRHELLSLTALETALAANHPQAGCQNDSQSHRGA